MRRSAALATPLDRGEIEDLNGHPIPLTAHAMAAVRPVIEQWHRLHVVPCYLSRIDESQFTAQLGDLTSMVPLANRSDYPYKEADERSAADEKVHIIDRPALTFEDADSVDVVGCVDYQPDDPGRPRCPDARTDPRFA